MDLDFFMNKIGLSENACSVVKKYEFSDEQVIAALKYLVSDTQKFLTDQKARIKNNYYEYMLALFVRMAFVRYKDYKANNYVDDVYFDTFKDIAIWNDVCIRETGVCGLKELEWLSSHMKLEIFRLGRLQFQPTITDENYTFNNTIIPKGSIAYNVHIPAGAPLTESSYQESYNQALKFFSQKSVICLCSSWLLSPTLDKLLPENSNILRFKSRYNIIKVRPEGRSAERYLFGIIEKDVTKYKADSSLSIKVKEMLLKGVPVGEAFGIYVHQS